LCIAVPCGLFALFGDLMFGEGIREEIVNWNLRSPHSLWFFENYGFFVLYLIFINSGFLLLFGYARFIRPHGMATGRWENGFWIGSLIYNIIIGVLNGWYVHGQTPATSFTNPFDILFWMVFVPLLGASLSTVCLIKNRNTEASSPP